ncbi:MAG: serine/threonine protein kinase [Candidatus Sericytochromatia bacterium]|nr:serine/threonine protein kinase [Candidatus Sericytochromatia bacterium]
MSLDNYEIVKELGRGGMGTVFLANDKRLKRQVAIKVLKIPPGMSDEDIEKSINSFKREAVAIANLAHNNIVCVYDIGHTENINYIVMELIDGAPLSKILNLQGQPFNLETGLKIADEICDSLSYIHKNKVIHRDIKPENIIYTAKGISKLTDFGISKFVGDDQLQFNDPPGSIKGTILYISPEQLQSPETVDGRADMYSFGVSLYELLTGKLPFDGSSPREVIMKILTDTPIAPSKIAKDLLPHIDAVIMKTLEKDPSKRYDSIDELRDELRNISDFRTKYAVQPMKKNDKQQKYYYSQIQIESLEDIVTTAKLLPEAGQQRFIYESEILLSKYMDEYKEQVKEKELAIGNNSSINQIDKYNNDEENNYSEDLTATDSSNFIQSFSCIVPKITQEGLNAARAMTMPIDLRLFLGKTNGNSTFKQIIDDSYSSENLTNVFNNLYNSSQKNYITLERVREPKGDVYLGEMLVEFDLVKKFQLDQCLTLKNKQNASSPTPKLIGEILLDSGYITRDKLLYILKLQHWYRRLLA